MIQARSAALRVTPLLPADSSGQAPALEVRARGPGRDGFFSALRALQNEQLPGESFVYVRAPLGLDDADIHAAASYIGAARLLSRVCLGYPYRPGDREGPSLCASIEAAGLRVAIDAVDGECSFADFVRYPVCGVRFCEQLSDAAAADPRAASVLEAMVNLARNLGIVTIATGVIAHSGPILAEIGVHYLGEADLACTTGEQSDAAAPRSSRSQYQGALYAP